MFNIYVLLLAFCYTPAGSVYGDVNTNENVSKNIMYPRAVEKAKTRCKINLERICLKPFVFTNSQ